MAPPRAFQLWRGAELCGFLGEGPGPFVTAVRSSLPAPRLSCARFVSRSPHHEGSVSQILSAATDFDAALDALVQAGFEARPIAFGEAFGAAPAPFLGGVE
ncbi:MAG: hypothetical protein KC933_10835 [Myxococcales bacterium]|nr:hypothetical protein [Myxococcales bacterium]MCB9650857.1 hypothetical protein [Deltaproteobacteria bacterium]